MAAFIGVMMGAALARADYHAYELYSLSNASIPDGGAVLYIGTTPIAAGGMVVGDTNDDSATGTPAHSTVWTPTNPSGTPLSSLDPFAGPNGLSVTGTDGTQQVGVLAGGGAAVANGSIDSITRLAVPSGSESVGAFAVSHGQVVGQAVDDDTEVRHAVVWTAGVNVDLNPTTHFTNVDGSIGSQVWGASRALATDGTHQVGDAQINVGQSGQAFMWSGTAASAVLLNPSNYTGSDALGVANGQEVGFGGTRDGKLHALLWNGSASSFVDLGLNAVALATNGSQQVGHTYNTTVTHAVMWSGSANTEADLSTLLPSSWGTSKAMAIDANGNVFGFALGSDGTYHVIEWTQGPAPQVAVLAKGLDGQHFSDALQFENIEPAAGDASRKTVGVVHAVSGSVTVFGGDGLSRIIREGDQLYIGDQVITGADGNVSVVTNGSLQQGLHGFEIGANQNVSLTQEVYDKNHPEDPSTWNFQQRVIHWFSGNGGSNTSGKFIGTFENHSDASDSTNTDINNGKRGAVFSAGSPVKLYTAVSTPSSAFNLGFTYGFADASDSLSISLGGKTIFSTTAADSGTGELRQVSLMIDDPSLLDIPVSELAFTMDGDHGTLSLLEDVSMPGLYNGDFSHFDTGWYSQMTDGSVDLYSVVSVPEPGAIGGLAMAIMWGMRRRRR